MKTETSELLPVIPECPSRVCLEDSLGRQERKVQVSVMQAQDSLVCQSTRLLGPSVFCRYAGKAWT